MADEIRQIRVRRDTAANWTGVVPANGEPIGIIGADGKVTAYKVGDGVTPAEQLPALSKGDKGDRGTTGPQGQPGTNGVATDEAVGTNITTAGSKTGAAVLKVTGGVRTNRVAILGDSIVDHNNIYVPSAGVYQIPGTGWFWWANIILRGALTLTINAGVSGQNTQQIGARVGDVIASGATVCVEEGGVNDINGVGGSWTAAQIIANRKATQDALLAAGIAVVAAEVTPSIGWTAAQKAIAQTVNTWLATRAGTVANVTVAKWWGATADPATGEFASGMSFDNYHPNTLGGCVMGHATAEALRPFVKPFDRLTPSNADPTNLLANGMMLGDTSGVPAGWSVLSYINNIQAVYTVRKYPASDGVDWWETLVTSGTVRLATDVQAGNTWAVGDKVVAIVEIDTESDSRSIAVQQIAVRALDSSGATLEQHVGPNDAYNSSTRRPVRLGVMDTFASPMTIPTGTATLRFLFDIGGSNIRHRIRRASIVKVS